MSSISIKMSDMPVISHDSYEEFASLVDLSNAPICLVGAIGIGKTAAVRRHAQANAERQGLQWIDWKDISQDLRNKLLSDTETRRQYHIFCELIVSLLTLGDLAVPDLHGKCTRWKNNEMLEVLMSEGAVGTLFLDEIGQADAEQQKLAMRLMKDKELYCRALSKGVRVVSATNRSTDLAASQELIATVVNRMATVEFRCPTAEEYINHQQSEGADERVNQYIGLNPGDLQQEPKCGSPFATPRSWSYCADALKGLARVTEIGKGRDRYLDTLETLVGMYVGPALSAKFRALETTAIGIDLKGIYEDPERFVNQFKDSIELRWLLATNVSYEFREQYIKGGDKSFPKLLDRWLHAAEVLMPARNTSTKVNADPNLIILMLKGFKNEVKAHAKSEAIRKHSEPLMKLLDQKAEKAEDQKLIADLTAKYLSLAHLMNLK